MDLMIDSTLREFWAKDDYISNNTGKGKKENGLKR